MFKMIVFIDTRLLNITNIKLIYTFYNQFANIKCFSNLFFTQSVINKFLYDNFYIYLM